MKTFNTNTPAAPIAIAAILMTAATLALCVGVPSTIQKNAPIASPALAQIQAHAQPAATEVEIVPGRIEVVAVRERSLHATVMRMLQSKGKQQV